MEKTISKCDLKAVAKKRYYYHLTGKDWGDAISLSPRAGGNNRDDNEPKIPRICVSSEVEGCFVAVYASELSRLNVYRTKKPVKAYKPHGIPDAHITKEHWILEDTDFVYLGSLDFAILVGPNNEDYGFPIKGCYGDGEKESMAWQSMVKPILRKRLSDQKYWYSDSGFCNWL